MDKFLDKYQTLKLNQDQVNQLINPIAPKEIEEDIKSLPIKKSPGPDRFSSEFYQTFIADITQILSKLFHEIDSDRILPH